MTRKPIRTTEPGETLFRKLVTSVKKVASTAAMIAGLSPVPAARPRVGRWGTYYPATYTKWMKEAQDKVFIQGARVPEGPLVLSIEHVIEKPRTSKRTYPRGDVDNLSKGPMDILTKTGSFWTDDDQVVLLIAHKRFARPGEEPGTYVSLTPTENDDATS